jgi:hypothetical protein
VQRHVAAAGLTAQLAAQATAPHRLLLLLLAPRRNGTDPQLMNPLAYHALQCPPVGGMTARTAAQSASTGCWTAAAQPGRLQWAALCNKWFDYRVTVGTSAYGLLPALLSGKIAYAHLQSCRDLAKQPAPAAS